VRFEIVNCYEDKAQPVVVAEWRSHLNPKTGKDYSNNGAFFVEIRDGRIYWVREYFDTEKAHANV
jgi:ketosteroid isomerase-like protein